MFYSLCFLDPCGSLPPCENGGTCESTEADQYKCLCAEGFTGTTCEDIGSEGGSSSAAIAGAVSAVVLLLIIAGAAVGAVVFFLWWRRKRQRHIVVQGIVMVTAAHAHFKGVSRIFNRGFHCVIFPLMYVL